MKFLALKMRAQIAIEYLAMLALAFSILALFIPVIVHAQQSYAHAIEKQKALSFLNEIRQTTEFLSVLGEGSQFHITVQPQHTWNLHYVGGQLQLTYDVNSSVSNSVSISLPDISMNSLECTRVCDFLLIKQNTFTVITLSDSIISLP